MKKDQLPWQSMGRGGRVFQTQTTAYIIVGNQTASPRNGENLESPGVGEIQPSGGKVVYEGSGISN